MMSFRRRHCSVVIPIYQPTLAPLEHFSVRYSLARLRGKHVSFAAPQHLDISRYQRDFPGVACERFDDRYFASIKGYNRLMLNPAFYQRFADSEFTLILQTDAIVLKDELDGWCDQPYDYVGAPWPDGVEVFVNLGRYAGSFGKKVKVHVGNGGFSLRRNAKCIGLLGEFAEATQVFLQSGSSEDLFFAIMGSLSEDFCLPNENLAAKFSLELKPEHYHALHGGRLPMGGHAWWRYNPRFWAEHLDEVPPLGPEQQGASALGASRVVMTQAAA